MVLDIRNRAVVSMFWDSNQPKGLLCNPKTGRKLLFGQLTALLIIKII